MSAHPALRKRHSSLSSVTGVSSRIQARRLTRSRITISPIVASIWIRMTLAVYQFALTSKVALMDVQNVIRYRKSTACFLENPNRTSR